MPLDHRNLLYPNSWLCAFLLLCPVAWVPLVPSKKNVWSLPLGHILVSQIHNFTFNTVFHDFSQVSIWEKNDLYNPLDAADIKRKGHVSIYD